MSSQNEIFSLESGSDQDSDLNISVGRRGFMKAVEGKLGIKAKRRQVLGVAMPFFLSQ